LTVDDVGLQIASWRLHFVIKTVINYPDPVADEADSSPLDVELFDSAEAATLAGWRSTPSARARIVAVRPSESFDGVYVTIATDGHPGFHDRDISTCVRAPNGKWYESGSAGA
jgi:hypothetical protein